MASLLIPVSVMGWSDLELDHYPTRHGRMVSTAVPLACIVMSNGGRTSEDAKVERLRAY